jgi:hypothetical protein
MHAAMEATSWSELYFDAVEVRDVDAVLLPDGDWHQAAEGMSVDRMTDMFELVCRGCGPIRGPMASVLATRGR